MTSRVMRAIDVSSHQPRDLSGLIAAHSPEHVIVKLYMPWETPPFEHSAAQVQSTVDHGLPPGGYAWCFRSSSPHRTIDEVILRCASINLVLSILWLDCETYTDPQTGNIIDPGPDAEWLAQAVERAASYGMRCGIYTGPWWIQDHFPGGWAAYQPFTRLPQWWSVYDEVADIDRFTRFPGVDALAAKQYSGTVVDKDVIWSDYVYVATGGTEPGLSPLDRLVTELQAKRDSRPYRFPKRDLKEILSRYE